MNRCGSLYNIDYISFRCAISAMAAAGLAASSVTDEAWWDIHLFSLWFIEWFNVWLSKSF